MPSLRHAIANDLRHRISSGHFKPGERLPAETRLATHYKVSTSTVRNALALLQAEGLVDKIHGSGNFVRRPLCRITYTGGAAAPAPWAAFSAHLRLTARTASIEAPSHLTTLLNVPPRSPLTEVLFTTCEEKTPHGLAHIYVPNDLTPATTPLPEQVAVRLAGRRPSPAEVQERISARLPTQEEAERLRISPSLAVLSLTRVTTDTTGRVIEAALLVLPGDRTDALFTTRFVTEERGSKK
ncbi:GntR family transcriptional regulator [Streptomyces sp. NPDC051815]|uniref:GntR family transcriptional regulator n=1 Tax=Streptomyces sp. NPDC051815 TaxID=3365674 RepID=UPI0037B5E289